MALPIGRTPILRGKAAESFIVKLKADLKKPVRLVPTPKIDTAKKMVLAHAIGKKKHA